MGKKDEKIVHGGEIEKPHRIFSSKRRTLLLTDLPRFIFINNETMTITKHIVWSKDVRVELKADDRNAFNLTTVKKVYQMKSSTGEASQWKEAVEKMLKSKK